MNELFELLKQLNIQVAYHHFVEATTPPYIAYYRLETNNFYADNALPEGDDTRLYFPADALQLRAALEAIFWRPGLRFLYSTRSATPFILNERGDKFFGAGYRFTGADEVIREGRDGYIVAYGEMLWRALHAVETLKAQVL